MISIERSDDGPLLIGQVARYTPRPSKAVLAGSLCPPNPSPSPSTSAASAASTTRSPQPVVALEGVDLEVEPGEFFGLLGPNGAGKTTLIKILTTLLLPTEGTARIFGFDVVDQTKQIRRIMNMVAGGEQSGYGILTVREQLWMFSQFYGLPVEGRLAPGRRADRGGRARRAARAAGQHAVDRPAPEDELRPRPAQRPVDLLPRRADARPRRRRGPLRPRAGPRLEGRGPRPDGPADDPLHGRGRRAVRADRDRRPRPDPRARHAGRAEAPRPARIDLPDRARPARRRAGRAPAGCRASLSAAAAADARPTARSARRSRSTSPSPRTASWAASSARSAERGSHILALRKSEPSLEDVFVELVGRGFDEEALDETDVERDSIDHDDSDDPPAPDRTPQPRDTAHEPGEREEQEAVV